MQIIRSLHNLKYLKSKIAAGNVATIGNYDGIHRGHQKILKLVKEKSIELQLPALVITFEPQPEEYFTADKTSRITSLQEKITSFNNCGIDWVLLLPFNVHLASCTALQFIQKVLIHALNIKHLIIGDDFGFGHNRAGNFKLLEQEAIKYGLQVTQIAPFKIDGLRVSSSLIRTALLHQNLDLATKFLGRPYQICGKVVPGNKLGHKLGFPTANIYLKKRQLQLTGVYAVKIYNLAAIPLSGIANIGFRPTIAGKDKKLEVHIFDFNANIYGKKITIEFLRKIRDEAFFQSLATLKAQIEKDVQVAKKLLR